MGAIWVDFTYSLDLLRKRAKHPVPFKASDRIALRLDERSDISREPAFKGGRFELSRYNLIDGQLFWSGDVNEAGELVGDDWAYSPLAFTTSPAEERGKPEGTVLRSDRDRIAAALEMTFRGAFVDVDRRAVLVPCDPPVLLVSLGAPGEHKHISVSLDFSAQRARSHRELAPHRQGVSLAVPFPLAAKADALEFARELALMVAERRQRVPRNPFELHPFKPEKTVEIEVSPLLPELIGDQPKPNDDTMAARVLAILILAPSPVQEIQKLGLPGNVTATGEGGMTAKAARARLDALRAARGFLDDTVALEEFTSAVTRLEAEMEEHSRVHAQDASSEQLADHLALQIAATRLAYPHLFIEPAYDEGLATLSL
ncbi:conserved hypothetical protein [Hyphomicrobiales bacterium]|jgi:hypothetical protein|nr:conserved hypothetical protein [Hyphomicrobiales bacterium]CAH1702663.1 hypothetical protein BOSEA1005_30535 [Hyphomicrobiales bacterium]CAI0346853.1 conserved hypothetical protein [Hyphomicrobiales bacterium]